MLGKSEPSPPRDIRYNDYASAGGQHDIMQEYTTQRQQLLQLLMLRFLGVPAAL